MADIWYTNFEMDWDHVLLSYYEDGIKKHKRIKLKPYLFVPSQADKVDYNTYDDKPVMRIDFDSVKETREFVRSYEDVANFKIYGSPLYHYVYMYENFKNQKPQTNKIKVLNYDIELDTSPEAGGFPTHGLADRPVNAITMKIFGSKDVYVLSMWDYDANNLEKPEPEIQKLIDNGYKIHHKKCKDEKELLLCFISIWERLDPDVVTGWNIRFFDTPYMVKRINIILGNDWSNRLSPFGKLKQSEVKMYGRDNDIFDIVGVPTLDYIDIYKKFHFGTESSYSLNYLSEKILDATKLDYSEYGSLAKLQEGNPEKFVSYNIIDVIRVEQIDEKIKYMDIAFMIAYETLTNFTDSLTTIRVWDVLIHNYLMDRDIVVPFKSDNRKDRSIAGGYVKEPIIGKHKWIMSFDFRSLYPHISMTYNISPDTYMGVFKDIFGALSVEKIMNGDLAEHQDLLERQNVCVTGAGTVFTKKKKGFLVAIMEEFFGIRTIYQKEENKWAKLSAAEPDNKEAEEMAGIFESKSSAIKLILNGGYGAFTNEFYRFFHNNIAESFTLGGQLSIKTVSKFTNDRMNEYLGTKDVDYIAAIDTDSQYIICDRAVEMFAGDQDPVDYLEKFSDKVQGWIQEGLTHLYKQTNAFQEKLFMNLESIGPAIWVRKKRYIISLHSFKKVRYDVPRIKMMGIEAVRSTTPQVVRKWIEDALPLAINEEETVLKKYIDNRWEEFIKLPFEEIAMPKGTNDLEKYSHKSTIYTKGTPIHVRGALLFNDILEQRDLAGDISKIQSGDKVKTMYLTIPNPLMENVISTPEILPRELNDISDYIDYQKQFDKVFLDALRRITDAAGINLTQNIKMDDFYG